ncbi:unnamed protein product, partial [Prorocentrum cordatum]
RPERPSTSTASRSRRAPPPEAADTSQPRHRVTRAARAVQGAGVRLAAPGSRGTRGRAGPVAGASLCHSRLPRAGGVCAQREGCWRPGCARRQEEEEEEAEEEEEEAEEEAAAEDARGG